ncbi:MAG: tRNA (guanosine(46)-N7)-methyltransferase TrmB [Burkholderiales bacterium]
MEEPPRRSVRSFVLRQGRVSNAQQRAWDTLYPRFGIPYAEAPLEPIALFGRKAPLILEIGSGMGETSVAIAKAQPGNDYIAIEVHLPGVGSLLKSIDEEGLTNLRVIRHDAVDVLEKMVPDGLLAGLHVFFPDPWPKKRHNKRRIIQPPLAALAAKRLAPGGYIHLATDIEAYAEHMLEVLSAEPMLKNTAAGYAPRPAYRPETKFESRGLRLGHGVWDLVFRRKG